MHLFITDSQELYEAHPSPHKCWIEGALVKATGFLTDAQLHDLNDYNNSIEIEAGESCLADLYDTVAKLKGAPIPNSPFIKHKPEFEQLYGLLFEPFNKFGYFRYLVSYWLRNFFVLHPKSIDKITFDLSETYNWLEVADLQTGFCFDIRLRIRPDKGLLKAKLKESGKNLVYFLQKYLNSENERADDATHILLVSYKLAHHTSILNSFYKLIEEDPSLVLHIVLLDHDKSDRYTELDELTASCNRIKTYEFKEFREGNFVRFRPFYKRLHKLDRKYRSISRHCYLEKAEVNYTWLNRAFEVLQPDVCMVMSTHETGRYLADVANYQNIPSVHFDYGLFSDHHIMESRIDFSLRASISQAVADIWIKRNDRSHRHVPIGYIKLDDMPPKETILAGKASFFSDNGFNPERPTIFFASSWALEGKVYDLEKITIVTELSERCMRNGWNLIVKKHPLEDDLVLEELLAKRNYPRQKIFRHRELSLNAAILFSDITTTQMSSIVLEAMFYEQPVCFLSTSENKILILAGMNDNPLTPLFYHFDDFENYLKNDLFHSQIAQLSAEEITRLKEYALYSTDQNTGVRLLSLVRELIAASREKNQA